MQKLAVVDGDRNADIYGYASSPEEAMQIAQSKFVDRIVKIDRYGPIMLVSGDELREAYVALTEGWEASQTKS